MKLVYLVLGVLLLAQHVTAVSPVFALNTTLLCLDVNSVPVKDQCAFVKANCNTPEHNLGVGNYLQLYYCSGKQAFTLSGLIFGMLICFGSLGLTASEYLCPNLYTISKLLKLSDNLAGLTLLAVGNGAADVVSTYNALGVGSAGLAISELVGAALFILTVVVGSISIVSPFKVPEFHFYRDVAFYLLISFVIVFSLASGELTYYYSIILFGLYVVYVVVAIYSHLWLRERTSQRLNEARIRANYEATPRRPSESDDSYFDSFTNLPSIDILNSISEENLTIAGEYENFFLNHPDTPVDERVPVETGQYGVRVLLRELSKHTVHQHPLEVTNERPLVLTPKPYIDAVPEDSIESPVSSVKKYLRHFFPLWEPESSILSKVIAVLLIPTTFVLRLTTPNRAEALEHADGSVINSNAFTFVPDGSFTQPAGDYDFATEGIIFYFQMAVCLVGLTVKNDLRLTPVAVLILSGTAYFLPFKAPTTNKQLRTFRIWNYMGSFVGFAMSLIFISIFSGEIIAVLDVLSVAFELSDDILGSTVFALGNSVGDLVSNLTIARMGMPVMAFGACFGGPLLSLCSLGFSAAVVMSRNDTSTIAVSFSPTLILNMAALIASLVFIVVFVPRNKGMFDRKVGALLIMGWILTVVLSIVLEATR